MLISLIFLIPFNFLLANTQVYFGEAFENGKLIYKEKHEVEYTEKKIIKSTTYYYEPSGELIAKLVNNYQKSINLPVHEMDDMRLKMRYGLRYEDERIILYLIEKSKEKTKKFQTDEFRDRLMVGGQGLHYFIINHFDEVISKKEQKLKFFIPGKLDVYDFYLKVKKVTIDKLELEILIDNWFLKLFAPKLEMTYDLKNKRLIRYRGLSNIQSKENKMMNVDIKYKYDP